MQPLIDPEMKHAIEGGLVVLVATRDAAMRPFVTRGWGPMILDGGRRMTVHIPRASSSRTIADLGSNGDVAVSFGDPATLRSFQLKGRCMTIDGPTAGALEWANQHFLLVASKMEKLGVPRPVAQRLYSTDHDHGRVALE